MADRTYFKTSNNIQNAIKDSVSFGDSASLSKIMSDVTVIRDPVKEIFDVNSLLKNAKNILIVANGKPNDAAGSAIAFALYIDSKFDKKAEVVYLGDVNSINTELTDLYEVKSSLEKVILKIELDYRETEIESCEWYKDEDSKKLVFEIKPIHKGFGTKRIKFKEEGLDYDLMITIGLTEFQQLGDVYKGNEQYFALVDTVSISNSETVIESAKFKIKDSSADFLTKVVFDQFIEWKFVPNIDISRCLLLGLSGK